MGGSTDGGLREEVTQGIILHSLIPTPGQERQIRTLTRDVTVIALNEEDHIRYWAVRPTFCMVEKPKVSMWEYRV